MNMGWKKFSVLALLAVICLCLGFADASGLDDKASKNELGQHSADEVNGPDGMRNAQNNSQKPQSPQVGPSAASGQMSQGSIKPSETPQRQDNENDPAPESQQLQDMHSTKDKLDVAQEIKADSGQKENPTLPKVESSKKDQGKIDSEKKDSGKKESELNPLNPTPNGLFYPEHLDFLDSSILVYYDGKSMPLSSFPVSGGNYLWVESTLGLVQYLSMTQGSSVSLMVYSSATGQGIIYEMYPSSVSTQGTYTQNVVDLNAGYNRLNFIGGTSGRHILMLVMNNQPSNSIVIDVSGGLSLGNALGT